MQKPKIIEWQIEWPVIVVMLRNSSINFSIITVRVIMEPRTFFRDSNSLSASSAKLLLLSNDK